MTESKFGTSGPITEEGPTPYGEFQYAKLLEYLHVTKKVFESADANKKRMAVFEKLNKIVREWASSVGKLKNVPEDVYSEGGGVFLKIFGSTRLGVQSPESDLDVLMIAPSFVTRQDFFSSFCALLRTMPEIELVADLPDSYTPVVKLEFDGQAIDRRKCDAE